MSSCSGPCNIKSSWSMFINYVLNQHEVPLKRVNDCLLAIEDTANSLRSELLKVHVYLVHLDFLVANLQIQGSYGERLSILRMPRPKEPDV